MHDRELVREDDPGFDWGSWMAWFRDAYLAMWGLDPFPEESATPEAIVAWRASGEGGA